MTDFLFAQPNALFGAARTLDLAGAFDRYNVSRSADEADLRAIANDWRTIGHDLFEAIARAHAETQEEQPGPR